MILRETRFSPPYQEEVREGELEADVGQGQDLADVVLD